MLRVRRLARRTNLLTRAAYGGMGLVGYILSPASWWNDAVVNIPIALASGKLFEYLLGIPLSIGFAVSYWLTNILGIVIMIGGFAGAKNGRVKLRDLIIGLLAGTAYTIVVIGLINFVF